MFIGLGHTLVQKMETKHTLHHELVPPTGGLTGSIFVRMEEWVFADSEHQNALIWLHSQYSDDRYRSVADWLFCSIYTQFRPGCMKFYAGKGNYLIDILEPHRIVLFDKALLKVVQHAYEMYKEHRQMTWLEFRAEAIRLAA